MRKLLLILTIAFVAVLSGYEYSSAFAKGDQDCTKCHTLNAEQAREALKEIIPDIKILDIQNGPISGLWEVSMESGAKKGILYIDYSKKTIIAGNILGIKTKTNYTQIAYEKINPPPSPVKIDYSAIPLENSLVMGNKNAKHKIIVFDDPD
jgi:thiol:disulfide interchange protein DsbC